MRLPMVAIAGRRGWWCAKVGGDVLAVLHSNWRVGGDRDLDPMTDVDQDGAKYREYVDALRARDRVVLQRDAGPGDLNRKGYVGIFRHADLEIGDDGPISLRLVERVANPAR
jgi:hypothetical protein